MSDGKEAFICARMECILTHAHVEILDPKPSYPGWQCYKACFCIHCWSRGWGWGWGVRVVVGVGVGVVGAGVKWDLQHSYISQRPWVSLYYWQGWCIEYPHAVKCELAINSMDREVEVCTIKHILRFCWWDNWYTHWDAWKGPALCQQHFQMAFLSWKIIPSKYELEDLFNYKSGNGLVLSDNKTKSEPQMSRLVTPYGVTTLQRVKLWTDKLMCRYVRPFTLYKQLSKKRLC